VNSADIRISQMFALEYSRDEASTNGVMIANCDFSMLLVAIFLNCSEIWSEL